MDMSVAHLQSSCIQVEHIKVDLTPHLLLEGFEGNLCVGLSNYNKEVIYYTLLRNFVSDVN